MRPVTLMLVLLAFPAAAQAHTIGPGARLASLDSPCGGTAMPNPDHVITGSFSSSRQGAYVMLPFTVPDRTTAVRVKYCHDQPDSPLAAQARHTLDMGIWERGALRGWGGSSHPDVTVSAEGFAEYGKQAPGKTTRAFRPGPVKDGRWAVELGLAAIVGPELGDSDGLVNWRVEIDLADDPAYADEPYKPARYDTAPVKRKPGWYAGDLHVHGEHSSLNDAPLTEVLDHAFGPAGLDFFTLSDYVGGAQWDEIARFTPKHPGKLVVRSAEVITYRGHINNHASATTVDHRAGPVYERRPDGSLVELRGAQPASRILRDIRHAGGVTQLNHVTIFPNEVPLFALMCRGCAWDYSAEETDWRLVDAIEIATGPGGLQDVPGGIGPNPFTVTAIDFYERALRSGERIAAVGSSDSHNAGRRDNPVTQAPIGQATTVVHAVELSERAIGCAIQAGHTYVKVFGADRPDLRLTARAPAAPGTAIFGDTVRGGNVKFEAKVLDAAPLENQPFTLLVVKDGDVVSAHPVAGDSSTVAFDASGPGRYGLRLMRGTTIEAVSTPIWVEPGSSEVVSKSCKPTKAKKKKKKRKRRARRKGR